MPDHAPPDIPGGPYVPSKALAFYAHCRNDALVKELRAAGVPMFLIGGEWQVSQPGYESYRAGKAAAAVERANGEKK